MSQRAAGASTGTSASTNGTRTSILNWLRSKPRTSSSASAGNPRERRQREADPGGGAQGCSACERFDPRDQREGERRPDGEEGRTRDVESDGDGEQREKRAS